MGAHWQARVLTTTAVVLCAGWIFAAPQPSIDVDTLMSRVGARLVEYYRRAQSVVCVEKSTVQGIEGNWTPAGMPRTVESELRVDPGAAEGDAVPEPTIVREVRRVNGRPPRDRDRISRAGCTDPNPLSPAPLAFLLPSHRGEYEFTSVRQGREHDRAAFIIEFSSMAGGGKPELIEDAAGHPDCFDWKGAIDTRGRVWVDAQTYDVLRVERRIAGPTSIRVPWKLQRQYGFENWIVLDRDDLTLDYEPVPFRDPDEVLLLPSSIVSMTILRSGLQSIRRTDTYSGYRRFLTNGRVIR